MIKIPLLQVRPATYIPHETNKIYTQTGTQYIATCMAYMPKSNILL